MLGLCAVCAQLLRLVNSLLTLGVKGGWNFPDVLLFLLFGDDPEFSSSSNSIGKLTVPFFEGVCAAKCES